MIYRVTFGFAGKGVGWGETHAMINGTENPRLLAGVLIDIAQKRAQMLGIEFAIIAIRIAKYATEAGVRQRGTYLIKQTIRNTSAAQQLGAEPAAVALLARGSAVQTPGSLFNANQNSTFLGAPLDISVDDGGVVYPGRGGLAAAFQTWKTAMTGAAMGWLVSDTVLDLPISAIVQNANGTVGITVEGNLFPTLTANTTYRARVRQVNGGVSPLNGELTIVAKTNNTVNSQGVIGIALAQAGGSIRVYRRVAPFISYGDISLELQAAQHQRGRPFGSPRGRVRRRIRG